MRIPLSMPDIGDREVSAVLSILRSTRLSLGPAQEDFEAKFADYVGTRYAIAVSSGTAALHLCVKALGIGAGDDAITTSFSFVASTNCLLYENASPVFSEINPHTLNLDANEIRRTIESSYVRDSSAKRWVHRRSQRTLKAILPVHVFGLPCDMNAVLEIANEFDLRVLEDACEALGAEYHGQRVGTFGAAAVFAFYPNKQLTTGEGGMIVTDDERIAKLCRSLRNQGRADDGGWLLHQRLGYNYRLSELQCALGLAQLDRIDELLARREQIAQLYSKALADLEGIQLPQPSPAFKHSWFTYVIQLLGPSRAEDRDQLMKGLQARGIDCRPYFPAIHRQPYFKQLHLDWCGPLPQTESASDRCLALPLFASMTSKQVDEVCSSIKDILAQLNPLARASEELGPIAAQVAP